MGSKASATSVYVIRVVGPGDVSYELPDEFPVSSVGCETVIGVARTLLDHLSRESDSYLGMPVVVDDVLETLEALGVSPSECGVSVVQCQRNGLRTCLQGRTVYAERVASMSGGKRLVAATAS